MGSSQKSYRVGSAVVSSSSHVLCHSLLSGMSLAVRNCSSNRICLSSGWN